MSDTLARDETFNGQRPGRAQATFFAWWRPDVEKGLAHRYWRDIHGVWAARTPGFFHYRQLHLGRIDSALVSGLDGVGTDLPEQEQPDGIAQITYRSRWHFKLLRLPFALDQAERDDANYVSRNTVQEASKRGSGTYVDLPDHPTPDGPATHPRYALALQKDAGTSLQDFQSELIEGLMPRWSEREDVRRLRLDLLEPHLETPSKPGGVSHRWEGMMRYDALIDLEVSEAAEPGDLFGASLGRIGGMVTAIHAYPIRELYTLVSHGRPTLAALRGYPAARTIEAVGAEFQKSAPVLKYTYGSVAHGARLFSWSWIATLLAGSTLGLGLGAALWLY